MRAQKSEVKLNGAAKNKHQEKVLEGVGVWASYYRANIHRFVEDYFHIKLKLFQVFLLYMMSISNVFVFIACRGLARYDRWIDTTSFISEASDHNMASPSSNRRFISGQNR